MIMSRGQAVELNNLNRGGAVRLFEACLADTVQEQQMAGYVIMTLLNVVVSLRHTGCFKLDLKAHFSSFSCDLFNDKVLIDLAIIMNPEICIFIHMSVKNCRKYEKGVVAPQFEAK
jgi:hypothetical protein